MYVQPKILEVIYNIINFFIRFVILFIKLNILIFCLHPYFLLIKVIGDVGDYNITFSIIYFGNFMNILINI